MAQDPKKAKLFKKNDFSEDILCQLTDKVPRYSNNLPTSVKKALRERGTLLAPISPHPMARTTREASDDTTPVDLISNAGVISIPDTKDVPNEYEFEILRLRRRVEELECSIRDRDERNVRAISMLEDELQMYRTYLHDHVGETQSGIQRRVVRIESTLMRLREKGSRAYPPLELPAGWKKLP